MAGVIGIKPGISIQAAERDGAAAVAAVEKRVNAS